MDHFLTRIPLDNFDKSMDRLNRIMRRRRLSFNPYTVSDARLMEIIETTDWGGEYDITQIVRLRFTRLREVCDIRRYDGIYMNVGQSSDEVFISSGAIKYGITASDTLTRERTMLDNRELYRNQDIEKLVGKSVFVSHTIRGRNISGNNRVVYRMYRLTGNLEKDAAMVRQKMCAAKIEMLQRILKHPECELFLDCRPTLFDFQSRINLAIEIIKNYNKIIPPK